MLHHDALSLISLFSTYHPPHSPPNKVTEVLWGLINVLPTLAASLVMFFSPAFTDHDATPMTVWLIAVIVVFAVIFAINSSIHSYLVIRYASSSKIAVSVGFYYMSNAVGRLFGTLGSGILYTYVGGSEGQYSGSDGTKGLAACFAAGTASSLLAALITLKIDDDEAGLRCGKWICVGEKKEEEDEHYEEELGAIVPDGEDKAKL